MKIRIAGTVNDSIVDGPGLRFAVFTQGCSHHCPGCHNPETHDPAGGQEEDTQALIQRMQKNPLLSGLTLFLSAWFTGLNNGPVSALVSFSRTFLFELGCVFLLPALFGMDAIWFSACVAEVLALILGAFLLVRHRGRYGY